MVSSSIHPPHTPPFILQSYRISWSLKLKKPLLSKMCSSHLTLYAIVVFSREGGGLMYDGETIRKTPPSEDSSA